MKVSIGFVFCLCLTCVVGPFAFLKNTGHSNYPGFCYFAGPPNIFLRANSARKIPNGRCGVLRCLPNFAIEIETCGSSEEYKDCIKVRGNPKKMFPACCDKFICAENNTLVRKTEKIK